MCIIIYCKDKSVKDDILTRSATINPHGLGITDLDTYITTYHLSTEWRLLSNRTNYVAHFRFATVGEISVANTHPFKIPRTTCLLYQNGTVNTLGNDKITDAEDMAKLLSGVKPRLWRKVLELTDCRWTIVDSKRHTVDLFNEDMWFEDDGSMFSKDNVLLDSSIDSHIVAVYGTLKSGGGNDHLLDTSTYLGDGTTNDKYPMVISGVPFVMDRPGEGHHVKVEVYSVNDSVLARLDQLEGHPDWYERRMVYIDLEDGNTEECWLYFCDDAEDSGDYYDNFPIRKNEYNTFNTFDYVQDYTSVYEKNDGKQCISCDGTNTMWDDYSKLLWCNTCDNYTDVKNLIDLTRSPF